MMSPREFVRQIRSAHPKSFFQLSSEGAEPMAEPKWAVPSVSSKQKWAVFGSSVRHEARCTGLVQILTSRYQRSTVSEINIRQLRWTLSVLN